MAVSLLDETNDMPVIVGVHSYSRVPANNFKISSQAVKLLQQLQQRNNTLILAFGNPYAIANFCEAKNLAACYEDDSLTHKAVVQLLKGELSPQGKLTVTVCPSLPFGTGITINPALPIAVNNHLNEAILQHADSIARAAIAARATPGCIILAAKGGEMVYQKAFGNTDYTSNISVTPDMIYDLASVTKTTATTIAVMKLFEEGRLRLEDPIGAYLPWVKGTDKEKITIKNLLLHQAGLVAWIPFYKETLDAHNQPKNDIYRSTHSDSFCIQVAEGLYLRRDWTDTLYSRIAHSKLQALGKYVYSDLDFIILGKIVEQITATTLDDYMRLNFYQPLGMTHTSYLPLQHVALNQVVPTENDTVFRHQVVQGYVHDPAAAMFNGISGHAGLFSSAYDIALLYQMLLNGGELNGTRYLKKNTIKLFTDYNSKASRRGLGFDKPEKDNAKSDKPYPAKYISNKAFGHTGFTGTCVWADPQNKLLYIFLSNRVNPDAGNNKLSQMNIRSGVQEVLYDAAK